MKKPREIAMGVEGGKLEEENCYKGILICVSFLFFSVVTRRFFYFFMA